MQRKSKRSSSRTKSRSSSSSSSSSSGGGGGGSSSSSGGGDGRRRSRSRTWPHLPPLNVEVPHGLVEALARLAHKVLRRNHHLVQRYICDRDHV